MRMFCSCAASSSERISASAYGCTARERGAGGRSSSEKLSAAFLQKLRRQLRRDRGERRTGRGAGVYGPIVNIVTRSRSPLGSSIFTTSTTCPAEGREGTQGNVGKKMLTSQETTFRAALAHAGRMRWNKAPRGGTMRCFCCLWGQSALLSSALRRSVLSRFGMKWRRAYRCGRTRMKAGSLPRDSPTTILGSLVVVLLLGEGINSSTQLQLPPAMPPRDSTRARHGRADAGRLWSCVRAQGRIMQPLRRAKQRSSHQS